MGQTRRAGGSSHFGRRRSVNVIAGLDPAIGSGTGSAKMPLNRMAIAGTDPRNKSEDDEKAFGPAKMRTAVWTRRSLTPLVNFGYTYSQMYI